LNFVADAAYEHGYTLPDDQQFALDLLGKWGSRAKKIQPYVTAMHPDHEVTFVSTIMDMGLGHLLSPYRLLMQQPLSSQEADQLLEEMMISIENHPGPWEIADSITNGLMTRFAIMLADHPQLMLFTVFRNNADSNILESVLAADAGKKVTKETTSFQSVISVKDGQTVFEAVKEAIQTLRASRSVPKYVLAGIKVENEEGETVTLKEFFAAHGEEIPDG
jgi:hypothetical protein